MQDPSLLLGNSQPGFPPRWHSHGHAIQVVRWHLFSILSLAQLIDRDYSLNLLLPRSSLLAASDSNF